MNEEWRFWWKGEIEDVKEILDSELGILEENILDTNDIAEKIVFELFGDGEK